MVRERPLLLFFGKGGGVGWGGGEVAGGYVVSKKFLDLLWCKNMLVNNWFML